MHNEIKRARPTHFLKSLGTSGLLALALVSCKSTHDESSVKFDWLESRGNGAGTMMISWPCSTRSDVLGRGNLQDEYCEWDRLKATSDGALTCIFRSSFDTKRSHWLPERYRRPSENVSKPRPEFEHTKSNSFNALVQIIKDCTASLDNHVDPDRVDPINHRVATSGRVVGDVDRASDTKICSLLHELKFKRNKVITPLSLPTPEGGEGRPGAQFSSLQQLPEGCRFDVDPNLRASAFKNRSETEILKFADAERTYVVCEWGKSSPFESCDEISGDLHVGVSVEVK